MIGRKTLGGPGLYQLQALISTNKMFFIVSKQNYVVDVQGKIKVLLLLLVEFVTLQ